MSVSNGGKTVSLAWRDIETLLPQTVEAFAGCEELDLSNNRISDIASLRDFSNLRTLILDNNEISSHTKFPKFPQLHTLWVNKNNITNLSVFIDKLVASTPNLKYLSMLNNTACPNFFNGGSLKQYQDYRRYVISRMRKLSQLDSEPVEEQEKREALRLYGDLAASVAFEESEYEVEQEIKKRKEEERRKKEREEAERRRAERIRKRELRKEAARAKRQKEREVALARQEREAQQEKAQRKAKKQLREVGGDVVVQMLPEVDTLQPKIATPTDLPDIPDAGALPKISAVEELTDSDEWSSDEDWDE